MLDNDDVMYGNVSDSVKKIPADKKDCHKCTFCLAVCIALSVSYYETFTLRKKCPYSEFFWSLFFLIRTEYGEFGLSVFSPNRRKYGPEKLRIRTLFMHC